MGTHDDQVDAMSGAMAALTEQDRVSNRCCPGAWCSFAWTPTASMSGRSDVLWGPSVRLWGSASLRPTSERTSMVTRIGPAIIAVEQWEEAYAATLERVDRHCREVGAIALYFDAGGSGASIRANLRQMWREQQLAQYPVIGVNLRRWC